ncbi:adenylate cyclase associated N terminal-domain-containing protein [Obelidium mucronatum]|nr:adenylate cyclase associated N terminal-domain-containing protein [Obelidium mucronatum]
MADLSTVLKRLEAATIRLEEIVAGKGPSNSTAPSNSTSTAKDGAALSAAVLDYDALIASHVEPVAARADALGGLLAEQAAHVRRAFGVQRAFVAAAARSAKPAAADGAALLRDTQAALEAVVRVREDKAARASPLFNHLSLVSEGIPALGWVAVEPTPVPYIGEMKDAAQFYSNRVIKEYKDKDKAHVEFAQAFIALLAELQAYVKKHHTTGVAWNPKGGDAKTNLASSAPAAAAPATPAPAPCRWSAAQLEQFAGKSTPAPAAAAGNLFAALNKEGLTSGLRKVDKSEMTHKNPELRGTSIVSASAKSASAVTPKASVVAAAKPSKLALEGNKWIVENFVNATDLVIKDPELRHTVYIYNCQNSTIQIQGKVNAVTLDNSKKTGLLVDSVVSTIDIVNCKSVQVQVTGRAPTVAIDKTDGCQVYLSKECVDGDSNVEVLTAMSSEVNVLVDGEGEDGGFVERPVPEQIKSTVRKGKMETSIVEHKG